MRRGGAVSSDWLQLFIPAVKFALFAYLDSILFLSFFHLIKCQSHSRKKRGRKENCRGLYSHVSHTRRKKHKLPALAVSLLVLLICVGSLSLILCYSWESIGLGWKVVPRFGDFAPALAHHFCLALPAAFTQPEPGDHLLAEYCTLNRTHK